MRTVILTRAIGGKSVEIPLANIGFLDDGPHGGAVVTVAGQRIGVKESRAEVRALIASNSNTRELDT